jgi:hypothetical protein
MPNPNYLRSLAERMLAMAITMPDSQLTGWLSIRASDHLDQAQALEAATSPAQPDDPEKKE